MENIKERLEYLRQELRAERISCGELIELQGLAEHIEPDDVELLEAAGVPEFPEQKYGVFTYHLATDECVDCEYHDNKQEAIVSADVISENMGGDVYVEVWKADPDGLWGNSGEPLWKSD